jgi:hypothetical protein
MTTLWAICGAGRGLGKTRLAQRLCAVLPDSIYIKHGHGPRQSSKPDHLVATGEELEALLTVSARSHDHVIVESNALALTGRASLVIYLEGTPTDVARREDADLLRSLADVILGDRGEETVWRHRLRTRLGQGPTVGAVLDALQAQARYLEHRDRAD